MWRSCLTPGIVRSTPGEVVNHSATRRFAKWKVSYIEIGFFAREEKMKADSRTPCHELTRATWAFQRFWICLTIITTWTHEPVSSPGLPPEKSSLSTASRDRKAWQPYPKKRTLRNPKTKKENELLINCSIMFHIAPYCCILFHTVPNYLLPLSPFDNLRERRKKTTRSVHPLRHLIFLVCLQTWSWSQWWHNFRIVGDPNAKLVLARARHSLDVCQMGKAMSETDIHTHLVWQGSENSQKKKRSLLLLMMIMIMMMNTKMTMGMVAAQALAVAG